MFNNTYKNKKVLITGHTGFKGSWLSLWLNMLGAHVYGISNGIPTKPSNYKILDIDNIITNYNLDITNYNKVEKLVNKIQPDFVFHLAAQALVKNSYIDPVQTIFTNAIGTTVILDVIRNLKKNVTSVIITSDKVYENKEIERGYNETDLIGGKDPYSASKGMAELSIKTYFESYLKLDKKKRLGISRAGNVIGGGDWANDRIVPDCIRAWSMNKTAIIRNINATRPWQHVLEPLSGYLRLGAELNENPKINGQAYNFGPKKTQNKKVLELVTEMSLHWENVKWKKARNNEAKLSEAGLLKLNCKKAHSDLSWKPNLNFSETVSLTTNWYKQYYRNKHISMLNYSLAQISDYCDIAKKNNLSWVK